MLTPFVLGWFLASRITHKTFVEFVIDPSHFVKMAEGFVSNKSCNDW